jgi:hypothetical protein
MSKVLTCAICRRRQAVGLLSMQSWATVNGARDAHACPDCQQEHHDWRERLARLAADSA